ncbi:glycerophosphodiester phosphodiesterase family protein [Azorhizobium doebereinerae]|uniref:glycerophosphodiester phosphodiesterase family protein n=1 Tax=Azorhizobium doebereinerae TaxID=281091 RepID=UPI00040782DC|nr:glycerophosphodiester phosphodiesterase family protein [Azorhizobium doebereinerae]
MSLTARPVAHRGLHDAAAGVIENTATAVDAAVAAGCAIEVDVQRSRDGEAMVFHDFTLDRLTLAQGPLAERTAAELKAVPFKATTDAMMTLPDLLERVAGRVQLIIEIKSDFSGDTRLAERAAALVAAYGGPAALMSFDPDMVGVVARHAPQVRRGIVAQRHYADDRTHLTAARRFALGHLLHWPRSRFQFVAYKVADLGAPAPRLARALGMPVLTWTVRTPQDRARAAAGADQMIFEGFRP